MVQCYMVRLLSGSANISWGTYSLMIKTYPVSSVNKIVIFGVAPPEKTFSIPPYKLYKNELTIMGPFTNPFTSIRSIALLSELELRPLITHKYKLCEIEEALEKHKAKEGIKILIQPGLEDQFAKPR